MKSEYILETRSHYLPVERTTFTGTRAQARQACRDIDKGHSTSTSIAFVRYVPEINVEDRREDDAVD